MERCMSGSQKPIECHVSFALLASRRIVQTFYTIIYLKLYRSFMLFPAGRMNAKSKIKIYKKIIEEVCRKYNGAQEFIVNKVKKLFSQEKNIC